MPEDALPIGAVAERFGLATHVLRHWESEGLLAPDRDAAGRRRYRAADLDAVAMIVLGKEAGLSLDDIALMFAAAPTRRARHDILEAHRARLADRLARTQLALDAVTHALHCDAEDFRACPHFRERLRETASGRTPLAGAPTSPFSGRSPGVATRTGPD